MKQLLTILFFLAAEFSLADVKDVIPPKPNPPRLVNDYVHLLSPDQSAQLEAKLDALNDSTSTQVAIVIVDTIYGYSAAEFAYTIGDVWGVGGQKQDNGVVILVVIPKADLDYRETFVAPGRGTEAVITDYQAGEMVRNILLPNFKNGDYYKGLDEAVDAIIKLTRGEFVNELGKRKSSQHIPFTPIIIIILIILFIISRINRGGRGGYISRRGFFPSPWLWGGMGGFGGGGGGFGGGGGGGGGGFGGFGGGSFGGGGAGGRW